MRQKNDMGSILWRDLTVKNADKIKDFYCKVVGWEAKPHEIGDYNDYDIMNPNTKETVAGICHKKGTNSNLPPQWLVYVEVEDVEKSANLCCELGGKVLDGPRLMGESKFCVIEAPEGAVMV